MGWFFRGELERASEFFERALAFDESYVPARYHLGVTLLHQGQCREAVATLEAVVAVAPDYPQAASSLGVAYNTAGELGELLDPMPELGLHLDIGHANLMVGSNTTGEILAAYGERLRHVHLHDNRGGHEDLHLPLGAGNVDLSGAVCRGTAFSGAESEA